MERGVAAGLLTFRDFVSAFQELDIDPSLPVIVHTSLSAFGQVQGGAPEVVDELSMALPGARTQTAASPSTFVSGAGVSLEVGAEVSEAAPHAAVSAGTAVHIATKATRRPVITSIGLNDEPLGSPELEDALNSA